MPLHIMKKYWLSIFFSAATIWTYAQGIIVNADGTHSIMTNTGIIVNSNGTHSIVVNSGTNISTVINPNGTHSTLVNNGNITTIVSPDGTQSVGINTRNTIQVITPDLKSEVDNIQDEEIPSKTVYLFNMLDEEEVVPVSKPARKQWKLRNRKREKGE